METKKSKVVATSLKKEGTGQYGAYYIHLIVFENGDSGDYMAKKNPQDYFVVGKEADYTKETKQNGQYTNVVIKPIQAQGGKQFFGGSPTAQNKRTALECSVRLAVAGKIDTNQIKAQSILFLGWLNADEQPRQEAPKQAPPAQQFPPMDDTSDLPF